MPSNTRSTSNTRRNRLPEIPQLMEDSNTEQSNLLNQFQNNINMFLTNFNSINERLVNLQNVNENLKIQIIYKIMMK